MNKAVCLCLTILLLPLVGCAFGYQARGSFSDRPGELRGKGYPGNTSGGGRFTLEDKSGLLRCDGFLAPPDATDTPGYCEGESGAGELRCSDGRVFTLRWRALSCRSMEGHGEDGRGARLNFRVDRPR